LDIIDRQPDGDHYFTQCQAGTFIGDISMSPDTRTPVVRLT
jgi:hypothetical protein